MLQNPFIFKKSSYEYEDETFEFTSKNLRTHFKNVYIFCKFNNNVEYMKILEGTIDNKDFKNIIKMFTLYETDISLIYNNKLNTNIIIVDSEIIKESNYFGYDLPEKILLLPIFNISFLNIQDHIDNITCNKNSFDKFYNELLISNFLKYDINIGKIKYISKLVHFLEIDDYWTKFNNCNININKKFESRKFIYTKNKNSEIISSAMAKINKNIDYFDDMLEKNSNKMIKTSDDNFINTNKYYYSKTGSKYTNEEINNIFMFLINKIDGDDLTSNFNVEILKLIRCLYNKLLKSKEYCHHAINNKILLSNEYINYIFKIENAPFINVQHFINQFRYAWTRFYMDEISKEGFLNTSDEIIFDIHTASKLPFFKENLYQRNPYLVIPIKIACFKNNIFGVDQKKHCTKSTPLGIVDLNTFKKYMNIFISGDETFNILDNIDFKYNKMAITGSIMPACLQKNNPLRFKFNDNYRYYSEYYSKSDIDVMVKTQDYNEFLNIVDYVTVNMSGNLNKLYLYSKFYLTYIKNTYVYITKNFIIENLNEYDYEYVKKNINSTEIVQKILPFISIEHKKYVDSLYLDEDNKEFMYDFDESLVNIILYDESKEYFNDLTIRFNIKVHFSSPHLSREFEFFMIKGDDFMNTVSRFHLPCVRAYYDGDNVYMTPSCITAYMTMVNLHYNYFSGKVCPMEIINKYRMRGFGVILNKKEIMEVFKYTCDTEYWRNLYGFKNVQNVNKNLKKFLDYIDINSPFFEPRKTNYAFYLEDDYVETNYNNVVSIKTTNNRYENSYLVQFNSDYILIDNISFCQKYPYFSNGNLIVTHRNDIDIEIKTGEIEIDDTNDINDTNNNQQDIQIDWG
jgi:hypothetical protein